MAQDENPQESLSVSNMKATNRKPIEEPYMGKLFVRFLEGVGTKLPVLLDKKWVENNGLLPTKADLKNQFAGLAAEAGVIRDTELHM